LCRHIFPNNSGAFYITSGIIQQNIYFTAGEGSNMEAVVISKPEIKKNLGTQVKTFLHVGCGRKRKDRKKKSIRALLRFP
jgi:hypothetical protein